MTQEELANELERCATVTDAYRIRGSVEMLPPNVAYDLLFTLATRGVRKVNLFAAALLVEVEPACPVDCEVALRTLASGRWQVSDHYVPFYLITQFGKSRLIKAVEIVANEFEGESRQMVETVAYQARRPAAKMIHSTLSEIVAWMLRNAATRS